MKPMIQSRQLEQQARASLLRGALEEAADLFCLAQLSAGPRKGELQAEERRAQRRAVAQGRHRG